MKKNAFWIGTGAAGAVVVIFFAVMVVPLWTKKSSTQGRLVRLVKKLKDEKTLPSTEDIESFEKSKARTIEQYKKLGDFYATSNDHLERWFTDLKLGANQDPQRDGFMAIYRREKDDIEKALNEKGVVIGVPDPANADKMRLGFNWEDPDPQAFGRVIADEKRVVKEIQKRFWARQRVANALLKILGDGGKVGRVHDFRFFRKLHPAWASEAWEIFPGGEHAVHYMGVGAQSNVAPTAFLEYDLPQKLGKTMTFGFAVELPYSQVPRLISEILNPAAEKDVAARLLVNVIGTHVTIREQNEPEVKRDVPQGDPVTKAKIEAELKAAVRPIDVLLTVTCQIVDFEPSELKKLDDPTAQK
ncbi:MAG TPA: hypothetical protein VJB14_17990 [Planctomycetota bacterium]|nr:hypothetical protein [Planctomycetota bacterium]